jgi:molybdopterin synthase catalytic subunit
VRLDKINIILTNDPLDASFALGQVRTDEAGGTCLFIGTVRNETRGKRVVALEFEAYQPMAISEMQKIAADAQARWPVWRISIYHRIGRLGIGEIPVVIAVSAAHRLAAFEACQYCIDTLKQTVPIWKKEIFEDGAIWVAAHP